MRGESSTVVVLVGDVAEGLLAGLSRSVNVAVARAPAAEAGQTGEPAAARPGWEAGALALREAARRQSTYVIVPDDPLADVAAEWRAMWDGLAGPAGAMVFHDDDENVVKRRHQWLRHPDTLTSHREAICRGHVTFT